MGLLYETEGRKLKQGAAIFPQESVSVMRCSQPTRQKVKPSNTPSPKLESKPSHNSFTYGLF